jgi:hypothetical protein
MSNADFSMPYLAAEIIKNHLENRLTEAMIEMSPSLTEHEQDQLRAALKIFERHGVGPIVALNILRDLPEVFNE